MSLTGIRKHTTHKARRNIIDCSIPTEVEVEDSLKAHFSAIFTSATEEDKNAAIARTTDELANHPDVNKLKKVGRRYETLAAWMCSVTNKLVAEIPIKAKIPPFTRDHIESLMIENSHAELDNPYPINPDSTTVTLASLSVLSYLNDRTITDRAELNDFACSQIDISEQKMVA